MSRESILGCNADAAFEAIAGDGFIRIPKLLSARDCKTASAWWKDEKLFRKHVDMGRHNFGDGRYGYFAEPLPPLVAALRERLYAELSPVANRMMKALKRDERYPRKLNGFLRRCSAAGQKKPTPLMLRYEAGGFNRLHRDLYGDLLFPLQATILLSTPGRDFEGGEFTLVENQARAQARARIVPLERGDAVIFPCADRPAPGRTRLVRTEVRHGVATVTRGRRWALGLIFHNAA